MRLSRFGWIPTLLALGFIAGPSAAQTPPYISFENADITIDLASNSEVQIGTDGNVSATCAVNDGKCGLTLSGTGVPTITSFTRANAGSAVNAGSNVLLSWGTQSAAVCRGSSTPALADWNNRPLATAQQGLSVAIPASTTDVNYALSLLCYNAAGASLPNTINFTALGQTQEPPPVTAGCDASIVDPLYQPAGWIRSERTWANVFTGCTFPNCSANNVLGNLGPGKYTSIKIDPQTAGKVFNVTTGVNQSGQNAQVVVTISTCPGDFRRYKSGSTDPLLSAGCRLSGSTLAYQTSANPQPSQNGCQVPANTTLYINLIAADLSDGLQAGENGCDNNVTSCGVYIYHSGF